MPLVVSESDLEVETLDKFLEYKAVKEKRAEMEKKLERLKSDKVGKRPLVDIFEPIHCVRTKHYFLLR
jgi:hypothetical protein